MEFPNEEVLRKRETKNLLLIIIRKTYDIFGANNEGGRFGELNTHIVLRAKNAEENSG